jgi:predicted metal-dependent hydrolase
MNTPYTLIRSSRRTLSIQISRDGELIARAPMRLSISSIESFIMSKETWIEKHKQKTEDRKQKIGERKQYSETEIQEMKKKLRAYIVPRVHELWE